MPYQYEYPRPALSVDCVVFGRESGSVKVLLIRRKRPPFEGAWAIPGGFVEPQETLMQAALRELEEETSVKLERAEQLRVFDAVDRDPRERVISVVHWTVVNAADHTPRGSDDASEAAWFDLHELPQLAFDHAEVLAHAQRRLTNAS